MDPIYLDDLRLDTTIRLADIVTVTISSLALIWSLISFVAIQKEKARHAAKLSLELIEGCGRNQKPLWHILEIGNYGLSPIVIRKILVGNMAIVDPEAGPLFRLDAGAYRHVDLSRHMEAYLAANPAKKWFPFLSGGIQVTLIDGVGRRWRARRVRQDVSVRESHQRFALASRTEILAE